MPGSRERQRITKTQRDRAVETPATNRAAASAVAEELQYSLIAQALAEKTAALDEARWS